MNEGLYSVFVCVDTSFIPRQIPKKKPNKKKQYESLLKSESTCFGLKLFIDAASF